MLITDRSRLRGRTLEEVASLAVEGGVNVVQLREKDLPTGDLSDLAATVHAVLRGRALLLINDNLDIALTIGADGVHLPEHSLPAIDVRETAGNACIVGRAVHTTEAAVTAETGGADYVQVGTIYETSSKPGMEPAGLGLITAVRESIGIPVIAVGGIDAANATDVIAAGADGVAVIGAIMDTDDTAGAANDLRTAVDAAYGRTAPTASS